MLRLKSVNLKGSKLYKRNILTKSRQVKIRELNKLWNEKKETKMCVLSKMKKNMTRKRLWVEENVSCINMLSHARILAGYKTFCL